MACRGILNPARLAQSPGDAAVGKPAMLIHASPRSLISRAALAEIMRTMSFDLYSRHELEVALLGKRPPRNGRTILGKPSNQAAMQSALVDFAGFIRSRRPDL